MRRIPVIAAALALSAGPALAMDCARAKGPAEKIVCAHKDVLALDAKLTGLYRRALDEGQEPETLRIAQRNWLADRDLCRDYACVERRYQARVDRLDDYLAALNADARRDVDVIPRTEADKRCLRYVPSTAPNATVDCRVADYKVLGDVGGFRRIFALYAIRYRWNGQDLALAAPVILTFNPADPTLLAFDFMITDAPGLAGEAAPEGLEPKVEGDRLVFSLPALMGGRDIRTFRLKGGAWEPVK